MHTEFSLFGELGILISVTVIIWRNKVGFEVHNLKKEIIADFVEMCFLIKYGREHHRWERELIYSFICPLELTNCSFEVKQFLQIVLVCVYEIVIL